ncbi:MAG: type II toxin-antitoxin system VapC family toxin [Verrucomicrobiaceae bacterium]|nr:type II toxin-antitoxin system VapC family toxin [Verrucomicrobiaceae bacterium]
MRLLIDTHALIWFCEGSPLLSAAARVAMEDESNERFISHAVPWEMAIKLSLGKLSLQVDYDVIFPDVLDANGFQMLPSRLEHHKRLITMPRHHGDPFDRMMIAQAEVEGLTLVSCDSQFAGYNVPLLW